MLRSKVDQGCYQKNYSLQAFMLLYSLCLGTMSGGGGRPARGRMSSKLHSDISPQQLLQMEKQLERDERALQVRGGWRGV